MRNIAKGNFDKVLSFSTNRNQLYFDLENGGKLRNLWSKKLS